MRVYVLGLAAVMLAGSQLAAAGPAAVSALGRALQSDAFREREDAEAQLIGRGQAILDATNLPLPSEDADPDMVQAHLDDLERILTGALQKQLYDHLPTPDYEGRFRLARIRQQLAQAVARRVDDVRSRYPTVLPAAELQRLHGNTGGFRDGTTWFDAEFHNHSTWTITSIRCLVRATDKSGKVQERVVTFTDPDRPLAPGGKAKWSADVGFPRGDNFYWETVDAVGSAPTKDDDKRQRIKRILEGESGEVGAARAITVSPRIIIMEEDEEKLGIDLGP